MSHLKEKTVQGKAIVDFDTKCWVNPTNLFLSPAKSDTYLKILHHTRYTECQRNKMIGFMKNIVVDYDGIFGQAVII